MSAILRKEQGASVRQAAVATSERRTPNAAPSSAAFPDHPAVFSINFIRHQTVSLWMRRALVYVVLGYLVANVCVLAGFVGTSFSTYTQVERLRTAVHTTTPSATAVKTTTDQMRALQGQAKEDLVGLTAIATQQQQRFPVAGKLAALTKTVPARTWITGISGARENRTILVQAADLVDPNTSYDLPTKGWMEALRADPSFGRGLKQLELKSSSKKMQGTAELVVFQLAAEWQPSTDH